MIDHRHQKQIGVIARAIANAPRFTIIQRAILNAAVWAMADEFSDVTFGEIRQHEAEFFCDCVKHHWAHNAGGGMETPCSTTHRAIRCPISDEGIISLVKCFESGVRLIWVPKKKARVA